MKVQAHGLGVELPRGWDARIYRRAPMQPHAAAGSTGSTPATTHAILHAGTFALPDGRGDFGTGAVERMRADDVLVVLFEYHPDAAATAMFRERGLPRTLSPAEFRPNQLQRQVRGQSGVQRFFQHGGRAFCLFVVLGSHARRARLVPRVNDLLRTLDIASNVAGGG